MHARNKYSVIMTSAAKERCFKKQNSYQVEIDNISFRCGGIPQVEAVAANPPTNPSNKQHSEQCNPYCARNPSMVTSPQHFSDWKRLGQGQHPSQSEKPNQERLTHENRQTDRIGYCTFAFRCSKLTRVRKPSFSVRAA